MDTVSQKYYIRLDKNLQCELICGQIQNLLTKFHKSNPNIADSFLCLEIKEISNSIDSQAPNLEYNNS